MKMFELKYLNSKDNEAGILTKSLLHENFKLLFVKFLSYSLITKRGIMYLLPTGPHVGNLLKFCPPKLAMWCVRNRHSSESVFQFSFGSKPTLFFYL